MGNRTKWPVRPSDETSTHRPGLTRAAWFAHLGRGNYYSNAKPMRKEKENGKNKAIYRSSFLGFSPAVLVGPGK